MSPFSRLVAIALACCYSATAAPMAMQEVAGTDPEIMSVFRGLYMSSFKVDVVPVDAGFHETWDITFFISPGQNRYEEFRCSLADYAEPPPAANGYFWNVPLTCDTPGYGDGYSVWLQNWAPLRPQVDKQQPSYTNRNYKLLIHNPTYMTQNAALMVYNIDVFSDRTMDCTNDGVPPFTCQSQPNKPAMSVSVAINPKWNPVTTVPDGLTAFPQSNGNPMVGWPSRR